MSSCITGNSAVNFFLPQVRAVYELEKIVDIRTKV